jgi:2-polyprenyl-6-methoxyphenol hydroxylase-like FAD-dependent oxidoreductase
MSGPYRVGVIGFGVAGATASYLLARAGHAVDLYERAPRVGPIGAGILLMPSGQAVLQSLGLLDKVTARGEPIEELHAVTHRGGTLVRLPFGEAAPGSRAYGLHRGDLFEVLHEAVVGQGVRIHLGREMQSYRRHGGVFLRDAGGEEYGPYDFLVAADGSRSRMRAASGLTRWSHEYAFGALWVIGRTTAVQRRLFQTVRGTHDLIGLLPMGAGRCSLFFGLRQARLDAVRRAGMTAWRDGLIRLCPLAEELVAPLRDFDEVPYTTYRHVLMRRWYDDSAVFLGDAAHAMSPHLGQGLNLALLDAWTFAHALERSSTPRAAFRVYQELRRPHLRYYAAVTFLMAPFFQSAGFVKGWGRDLFLPWMPRLPWLRRQMLLTMAGIKGGFFAGPVAPP